MKKYIYVWLAISATGASFLSAGRGDELAGNEKKESVEWRYENPLPDWWSNEKTGETELVMEGFLNKCFTSGATKVVIKTDEEKGNILVVRVDGDDALSSGLSGQVNNEWVRVEICDNLVRWLYHEACTTPQFANRQFGIVISFGEGAENRIAINQVPSQGCVPQLSS